MAAVLLYFRGDLARIAAAWWFSLTHPRRRRSLDARLGWYIVLGTIPISVFGLVFKTEIETVVRDLYLISAALIGLGLLLLLAERVGSRSRGLESLVARDGVAVGFAQALALIPGVSRSGATITAGLFLGLDRPTAARFSFLLSVPAVVLSGLLELGTILEGETASDSGFFGLIVATALAFAVGYASIAFLLRFLATHSTAVFVVYRVGLGVLVLALAATGAIR
jgi:undecaprenyl-diphosphatase